jgi:hypothetical protein
MDYEVEYIVNGGAYNAIKMTADNDDELIDNIMLKENNTIGRIFFRPLVLNERREFQLINSIRIY